MHDQRLVVDDLEALDVVVVAAELGDLDVAVEGGLVGVGVKRVAVGELGVLGERDGVGLAVVGDLELLGGAGLDLGEIVAVDDDGIVKEPVDVVFPTDLLDVEALGLVGDADGEGPGGRAGARSVGAAAGKGRGATKRGEDLQDLTTGDCGLLQHVLLLAHKVRPDAAHVQLMWAL